MTNRFAQELRPHYGQIGSYWRGKIFDWLDRPERSDKLLVDGIAVAEAYRGHGVGTLLMSALERKAQELGKVSVRLDVIDRNVRARVLYDRLGYEVTGAHDLGVLRHAFGFRRATQMTKML